MTIFDPQFPPPTPQRPQPPLTIDDVAFALGVCTRTVHRLIASGRLRKLPLQRAVRVSLNDLKQFLAGDAGDKASPRHSE